VTITKKLKTHFLFIFFGLIFFVSGYLVGTRTLELNLKGPKVNIVRAVPQNRDSLDFSLFWKVWDTLSASYFDKSKLVDSKMVYGAISGMVSAIGDPYTIFLPPSENKVVDEDLSGRFEGIGIQIGFRGTQLAVIAPLPDSPAQKAGIKAGDYIIGIEDLKKGISRGTSGITLPDAVEAIRGKSGTSVKLTLLRTGMDKPIEVDVTRERIDVPSVTLEMVGDNKNIAHIRLSKFSAETKEEWDEAVTKILKDPNVKGIIIDERNNPGGYLQAAVDLASDFIPVGKTVVIEENGKGQRNEYKVERIGRLYKIPVVVLQNGGSASASEILAGALRDQNKTLLIGEKSFGKGTIQEPIDIEGESGLHITIAKWLTPNAVWVNEKGLEPDIKVEDKEDTQEDEQLQKAIEYLL